MLYNCTMYNYITNAQYINRLGLAYKLAQSILARNITLTNKETVTNGKSILNMPAPSYL